MATSKKTAKPSLKPVFTVVTVNEPLEDVTFQNDMFDGQPEGRYVINYVTPLCTQSLSVKWDGVTLSL
jgi:hypothetical protein